MSNPGPDPQPTTPPAKARPFWRLSRRTWLWVGAAVIGGLLLFLLLLSTRHDNDFFRVAPTAGPAENGYEPLPVPLPAEEAKGDSNMPPPEETARPATARIVETPPLRPSAPIPQTVAPPAAAMAPTASPTPLQGQTPAPRYPAQALRRGLGGTVRVRADVGADGAPASVSVVETSGNRELDRAALEAVRRWRFQPATANGQPAGGSVVVPIEFNPGR